MGIRVYQLFEDVEAVWILVNAEKMSLPGIIQRQESCDMEIHFCIRGRIEQKRKNEFIYLMPGDCRVSVLGEGEENFVLPLNHYEGMIFRIGRKAAEKFSNYMENDRLNPQKIVRGLCGEMSYRILRSVKSFNHIFSELDEILEDDRKVYLKWKILELFFWFHQILRGEDFREEYTISPGQAELVTEMEVYILDNLHKKISIKELTGRFGISDTHLQRLFQSVYGMPAASFIRMQKMQKAALQLTQTDRRIDQIAADFGYMNESKFSAAFQKIMGESPSIYRKKHSNIKILG